MEQPKVLKAPELKEACKKSQSQFLVGYSVFIACSIILLSGCSFSGLIEFFTTLWDDKGLMEFVVGPIFFLLVIPGAGVYLIKEYWIPPYELSETQVKWLEGLKKQAYSLNSGSGRDAFDAFIRDLIKVRSGVFPTQSELKEIIAYIGYLIESEKKMELQIRIDALLEKKVADTQEPVNR